MQTFKSYFKNQNLSESLKYHLDHDIPLSENIFRIYSDEFFNVIKEARQLYYNNLLEVFEDDSFLLESDLGEEGIYEGRRVFLDAPIPLEEDIVLEAEHRGKKINLNRPFRTPGGPKKFAVYVKNPKGNVIKVTFGDPNMKVRNASKSRAKSFRARHKCDQKKDKTTAGYWSCNIHRYRKALGLKSNRVW
jgi:hypothetical protein